MSIRHLNPEGERSRVIRFRRNQLDFATDLIAAISLAQNGVTTHLMRGDQCFAEIHPPAPLVEEDNYVD